MASEQQGKFGKFTLIFNPTSKLEEVIWRGGDSAILGRSGTKQSKTIDNFIGVGTAKSISRQHAELSWNVVKGAWNLRVLGVGGIWTNSYFYQQNETILLSGNCPTPLQLGKSRDSKLYFCPAHH